MYNDASILALINRIGWNAPIDENITLSGENSESVSSRNFNSFHQLVTVDNVFNTISNSSTDNKKLNDFLFQMKKDCVYEVLNKIFDINIKANYSNYQSGGKKIASLNYAKDYSDVIIEKQALFDESIGYSMVVRCLQLFLTSNRINEEQRSISMSYELLKGELEGIRNVSGILVAKGANEKLAMAISDAIDVLFQIKETSIKTLVNRNSW